MAILQVSMLATVAMIAFAANSLLCRLALVDYAIDPASFTFWRLVSGAITLWVIVCVNRQQQVARGSYVGAIALFVYAAGFSLAYVSMSAGAGALILFGSVQLTMISWGLFKGERFSPMQWFGFILAFGGVVLLMLPSATTPRFSAALLMIIAGVAWGVYSILGKGVRFPTRVSAGNFVLACPLAIVMLVMLFPHDMPSASGIMLAVVSGAIASGLGYAIWYHVLPHIPSSIAASLQLTVPVIAMVAGWIFLNEMISKLMVLAAVTVLGGIAIMLWVKPKSN